MYDDPLRIIAASQGVFLYREALGAGYLPKQVAAMRRSGGWHRVRHGAYCFGDVWATLSPEERHLLLARAVLRTTPGPVALSHTTAVLAHGVAVWGADLRRVHVTRLDRGAGRVEKDVQHHVGACTDDDIVLVERMATMKLDRALIEMATLVGIESSMVSLDNALHRELCTPDGLHRAFEPLNHWCGSQRIHVALHHMDGRAESVGESRSRVLFWRQGLPRPELQFKVYDGSTLVATTDFAWEDYKVFGEFDGKEKYLRFRRPGESPGDAVFREKKREDLVRRLTDSLFGRLTWVDLHHPERTGQRFRELLSQRRRLR